jgi:diaminopimelate epimerase
MHGIGNDYIYVNCFKEHIDDPAEFSKKYSDRHFGIGGDGLVMICPSEIADFKMRMFNADGSEGKMCGNATRCIGKYVYDNGLTDKTEITLETLSGIKYLRLNVENGKVVDSSLRRYRKISRIVKIIKEKDGRMQDGYAGIRGVTYITLQRNFCKGQ